jgi:hypothetical protein
MHRMGETKDDILFDRLIRLLGGAIARRDGRTTAMAGATGNTDDQARQPGGAASSPERAGHSDGRPEDACAVDHGRTDRSM